MFDLVGFVFLLHVQDQILTSAFVPLQTKQFDVPGAKRKDNQEEGSLGSMQLLSEVIPTMNLASRTVSQLKTEVSALHTAPIRSSTLELRNFKNDEARPKRSIWEGPGPGEMDTPILHASRPHDANEYFNNMQLPGPPTYELPSDGIFPKNIP